MISIDDLVGHEYGNCSDNGSEEGQESQVTGSLGDGKDRRKEAKRNDKAKQQYTAYKYSNRGRGELRETVVLAGRSVFLKYENGEFKAIEHIEEESRIIKPPSPEEYPYESYEFANMGEVKEYAERAKSMSIDSLYTQVKQFAAHLIYLACFLRCYTRVMSWRDSHGHISILCICKVCAPWQ